MQTVAQPRIDLRESNPFGSMAGYIDNDRFRRLLLVLPGKAIAMLYNTYYTVLVGIAESLVHDRWAAEDIVQETFIHVWEQHLRLGRPDDRSIEHYLVRVVRNKSISWYKAGLRMDRYRSAIMNGHAFTDKEESAESRLIGMEMSVEIRKVISTFPRRETECLLLRLDEELNAQQIADRLKVSRKAVERSLTSANKRLRKYLRSHGYAVSEK